ncbi:rod shape-determining protein RodA [Steroidobacter agaridevorans]|uniref:Rod shape-determining protein RodA n=1 Tax=Steroidobacter agaridevorans TaxID=2695856 RepID=A0A829Y4I5_9GAMM|nr:DUF4399 domain-containing protein [Steroidobacter agaridevorans]GFE78120.1 rod shape-determining protein RodA [Steroidobacter agaridevorans]GFE91179.1 rod shape-determining protein RodA [Steroidobacter agaridevorans]
MKHQFKARFALAAAAALSIAAGVALADGLKRTPSPAGAEVYFIAPVDGATVTSPVTVKFGLKGMGIAPAGITFDNTGHHHLIIDADLPPAGAPIPTDANHMHFGKGQTEATLELKPGKHTLQLLLGDFGHVPHDPIVTSKKITITVK